jgi:O-antigen/teichoic acid export membrane protein
MQAELKQKTIAIYRHFMHDSLYRNSIFLILSSLLSSGMGFVFWKINTQFYSPKDIGIATSLITICQLLIYLSPIGINQAIIKVIPLSKNRSELISTVLITVSITATLFSVIYLIILPLLSPKLTFLYHHLYFIPVFLLGCVISTINNITDNIFVALKSTIYIIYENIALGILKVTLPLILLGLGTFGIFTAYFACVIGSLAVTIYGFYRLNLKIKAVFRFRELKNIAQFSLANYVAAVFGNIAPMLMPTLIVGVLGASQAAYYFIATSIANIVSIVPQSTSSALYAEISHNPLNIKRQIFKSLLTIVGLMLPLLVFLILFSGHVLLLFGKEYSYAGSTLLRLLVLSTIPIAISNVMGQVLRYYNAMVEYIFIELFIMISAVSLSIVFMKRSGIVGVGYSLLIANSICAILFVFVAMSKHRRLSS